MSLLLYANEVMRGTVKSGGKHLVNYVFTAKTFPVKIPNQPMLQ